MTPVGTRIDDRLLMRTMEVDFRAAVDPYADAVAILSLEGEAGEGFSADLEEGYVVIERLPILESAPRGLKLKLGRYRAAMMARASPLNRRAPCSAGLGWLPRESGGALVQ